MKSVPIRLACFLGLSLAVVHAASDVTVTTAATSGGTFSGGNPNVFTPTASPAVANNSTIQTALNAGTPVTLNTSSAAAGNGDLVATATISKTAGAAAALTLNAVRDLTINGTMSSTVGSMPLALTAGRAISSTAAITTLGGNITINTVQPFTLGNSLNAGTGQVLLQTGSIESSASRTVTASSVQVSAGATWKHRGTIAGNLSVGGTLSAGPAAGSLQVNGTLTLQPGATTLVDLAGTGQGSTYDSITATGTVTLAGALQLSFLSGFENNIVNSNSFTILTGSSVTGTFTGLANNSRITLPNELGSVKITYNATNVVLSDWQPVIRDLTWDPGTTDAGSQVFNVPAGNVGGRFYFRITSQATAVGAWRTALRVTGGTADVYLKQNAFPDSTSDFSYKSDRAGTLGDGFVLPGTAFGAAQTWYLMVSAGANSQWSLVSGEAFVQDLGTLASDATSSSGNVQIGAEGYRFFKTSTPPAAAAWRVWLNDGAATPATLTSTKLAVRRTTVPFIDAAYDHQQLGHMLLVPPYLNTGGDTYFLAVSGTPGTAINLDSRSATVTDVAFGSSTAFTLPTAGYAIYRTQVPIDQIGWQTELRGVSANVDLAVRRDNAASEWFNDAFSEVPGTVGDSVTLVPPTLTNGTYYMTIYNAGVSATGTLVNRVPFSGVPDDVAFIGSSLNDEPGTSADDANPNKAGWRYFRVGVADAQGISEQLGKFGWELALAGAPTNTEIALRRNFLPGRWLARNAFGGSGQGSTYYQDFNSPTGLLPRPGHQADIWYIGIYAPAVALGNFSLLRSEMIPQPLLFANGSFSMVNQAPGTIRYFTVNIPTDPELLGWDLRGLNTTGPVDLGYTKDVPPNFWNLGPSAYWTHPNASAGLNPNWYSHTAVQTTPDPYSGRWLGPGLYYIGVRNNGSTPLSYTLQSRGIGTGASSYPIKSQPLDFANGTATVTDLPARESAYYSVTVPAGANTWRLKAAPTGAGEVSMKVRRTMIPASDSYYPQLDWSGVVLKAPGNEVFYEAKSGSGDSVNLPAGGTYYIMVTSAGTSPPDANTVGTGTASAVLTSVSDVPVTALGGGADVTGTPQTAPVGLNPRELEFYSFNVAPGTLSVEVRLTDKVGGTSMAIALGGYPAFNSGGVNSAVTSGGAQPTSGGQATELATLVNPAPGLYTIAVIAGTTNATANLSVVANVPLPLSFANGSVSTVNQAAGTIRYFSVNIPTDTELLGWDLRGLNTTGPVDVGYTKDVPPNFWNLGPSAYWTHPNTSAGLDQNWYSHTAVQTVADPPSNGSRWLGPGLYYIGVRNNGSTPLSYTLQSRGIGTGVSSYPIKSQPLNFANGTATVTDLPAREAAFYSVTVPAGANSWRLKAAPTGAGEVSMKVRRRVIPASDSYYPQLDSSGVVLKAPGNDVFYEAKSWSGDPVNLPAGGTYHIMVTSAGTSPPNADTVGTGTASAVLTSLSDVPVTALGGGADVTGTPQTAPVSLNRRELEFYSFNVAPGTLSVEVRLNDRVGGPGMTIAQGAYPSFAGGPQGGGFVASGGAQPTSGGQALELATLVNPSPGLYTVAVIAGTANATGTLSVVANVPQSFAFADGSVSAVSQLPDTVRYFTVDVPTDSNLLGWDLRTLNATGPIVIQARLGSPPANDGNGTLGATTFWTHPNTSAGGTDNNRYLYQPVRTTPGYGVVSPGTWYIGVRNSGSTPVSYTLQSRGIGTAASSYPIKSLPLSFTNGTATITELPAREAAFFTVEVPAGAKTWELKAVPGTTSEVSLAIRRSVIPQAPGMDFYNSIGQDGVILRNPGTDIFYEGRANATDLSNLPAGTYHIAVISAGTSPLNSSSVGTGSASAVLTSVSDMPVTALGGGADVTGTLQTAPVSLNPRELKLFSFSVAPGTLSVEVRLNDRVGGLGMTIAQGAYPSFLGGPQGGGVVASGGAQPTNGGQALELATLVNPSPGLYTTAVIAGSSNATATLSVVARPPTILNFSSAQNGSGGTNFDTTATPVIDGTRSYYQITVPTTLGGGTPLGWKLSATTAQGAASLYVYRGASNLAAPVAQTSERSLILAPPVFSPGTYMVEVRASGATSYTLTSETVTPRNAAAPWLLPTAAAYTTANDIGDSGQLDLANGDYDFYAVTVPEGNAGVLRTVIEAISGNPDLYIRRLSIPSHNHTIQGSDPDQTTGEIAYSRALTNPTGTEYGNWVPYHQTAETRLRSGTYYLAVHAASNTNVRYRLRVSPGAIQSLALNGGNVSNQLLTGGDWRYYKVELPPDATMPQSWQMTFAQNSGDAIMFLRDTVPPGLKNTSTVTTYGDETMDWQRDAKNANTTQYSRYDNPGSYTLTTPPLRPGTSYYVGVYAKNDSSFSLSSSTSGNIGAIPTLDFYTGTLNTSIPANSSALYEIPVPESAIMPLAWTSTHLSTVQLRVEQGTLPASTGTAQHYYSSGANSSFSRTLSATTWPWQPGQTYYLRIVNNAATAATVTLTMNFAAWQQSNWAGITDPSIIGTDADPDGDGATNEAEFVAGTDPKDSSSFPSADGTWLVDADGSWSDVGKWSGAYKPNGIGRSADFSTLNISADRTVTLNIPLTIGSILFGDTSGSQNWTLAAINSGAITLAVSSGAPSISVNGSTAIISVPMGGTAGLNKVGSGILSIHSVNTYTGATTIKNGSLALDVAANRLATTGSVVLGDTATTGKLVLGGTTVANQTFASLTTTGLGGSVVGGNSSNSTLTLNIASSNTFSGTLGGAGTNENNLALTKSGTGTLTLSGANTYAGPTIISAGTLSLSHVNALGSTSALTLAGGTTLSTSTTGISTSAPITLGATGTTSTVAFGIATAATGSITLNGLINGAANLTFTTPNNNSGNFLQTIFLGSANSYTGTTLITTGNAGNTMNVRAGIANALPTTTVLTLDGGNGSGSGRTTSYDLNGFNQTLAGLTNVTGRTLRNQRILNTGGTVATLTIQDNSDRTFSGNINGTNLSLTKTGTGKFTLPGANAYTGNTTVTGGTLSLGTVNAGNELSTVTIAASSAALQLNFPGTDTVARLFIGTNQQPAGTYGHSTTGATNGGLGVGAMNAYFASGTGTLTVTTSLPPAGYGTWQAASSTAQTVDQDHDNDGVANGIEYFLGGSTNTTGFTALPGVTNTAGILSITWTKATTYTGTYGTHFWVETSATLSGAWTIETSGVNVTFPSATEVKYTFPASASRFVRLKASQ